MVSVKNPSTKRSSAHSSNDRMIEGCGFDIFIDDECSLELTSLDFDDASKLKQSNDADGLSDRIVAKGFPRGVLGSGGGSTFASIPIEIGTIGFLPIA